MSAFGVYVRSGASPRGVPLLLTIFHEVGALPCYRIPFSTDNEVIAEVKPNPGYITIPEPPPRLRLPELLSTSITVPGSGHSETQIILGLGCPVQEPLTTRAYLHLSY